MSATPVTSPAPSVDAGPIDYCAGALHLALGGSTSGTTCTGTIGPPSFCMPQGAYGLWVYVDAPDADAIILTPSPGLTVATYAECDSDSSLNCGSGSPTFLPTDPHVRLFNIFREDTKCGTFTLSVAVVADAGG